MVGLEQAEKQKPVKILSIYPGIVDTEMQEIIRNSSKDAFQDVDQFIEFKETNKLIQPEIVAKEIEQIYYDTSIKNGSIVKVVDYRN